MWTSATDCCSKIIHQITRRNSVLYVCERVNSSVSKGGCAMATTRDRSRFATSQQAVQNPLAQGLPYQIAISQDGEVSNHQLQRQVLKHTGGPEQESEILRPYLKAPENKSLSDLEGFSPPRPGRMDPSYSMRGMIHSPSPLLQTPFSVPMGGSPKGKKNTSQKKHFQFLSTARDKSGQESSKTRQLDYSPCSILSGGSPSKVTEISEVNLLPCKTAASPGRTNLSLGPSDQREIYNLQSVDDPPPAYTSDPNLSIKDRPNQRTSSGNI